MSMNNYYSKVYYWCSPWLEQFRKKPLILYVFLFHSAEPAVSGRNVHVGQFESVLEENIFVPVLFDRT